MGGAEIGGVWISGRGLGGLDLLARFDVGLDRANGGGAGGLVKTSSFHL